MTASPRYSNGASVTTVLILTAVGAKITKTASNLFGSSDLDPKMAAQVHLQKYLVKSLKYQQAMIRDL